MPRIVLYAMAHRGDVFPYVPVASELARRGHDVYGRYGVDYGPRLGGGP